MSGKIQKNVLRLLAASHIPEVSDEYLFVVNEIEHFTPVINRTPTVFNSRFFIRPCHFATFRELGNKRLTLFGPLLELLESLTAKIPQDICRHFLPALSGLLCPYNLHTAATISFRSNSSIIRWASSWEHTLPVMAWLCARRRRAFCSSVGW